MRILESALFVERLIAAFGLQDAARLYSARARSKLGRGDQLFESFSVQLRGFSAPLHLRFATSDWNVFEQIFVRKEYEDPTSAHTSAAQGYYNKIVSEGLTPVIIDCGGNVGLAAVWYARKYPMAHIYSIEPQSDNFKLLQKNTLAYANITPVQAAVGSMKGRLSLANATGTPWAWTTLRTHSGEIDAVTIDELLNRSAGVRGFIIKVDIEGFETDLFAQNTEWLADFPVVIAETHDFLFPWKGTSHSIFSTLVALGTYDYVQKGENCFCYAHERLKPTAPNLPTPQSDTWIS